MDGTPRLRSAYPSSPRVSQKERTLNSSASGSGLSHVPLPPLTRSKSEAYAPLIPFSLVDAPSQRLYVLFFYAALTTWRLCDSYGLISDEADSLWHFMKWVAIDITFLYGLPGLRIPWLQWSSTTTTTVFLFHAVFNALLMFHISVGTVHVSIHIRTNTFRRFP